MLDGGSGVDICPLSTLQRMEIGTGKIRPNNVCVRAFDGIKRETLGEIDLILTIGPVEFEVTFQVLDMDTSYNFLLGRPWIHVAGAIPSTLHQMVKFEYEDREIVVHGEDEQSIYRDTSIPYLEAREGSEHTVYQAFEGVLAEQYEEGSPCPPTFLVQRFNHGFHPTPKDEDWAKKRKNEGWKLPQPLPHLYETFVIPKYTEEEDDEPFTAEKIEEIYGVMREMLYETHMVQLGEGTSTAEVLMDEEDAKKTAFTTPWVTYYYRVMPFGLKNAGAIYMRAMTAIFHNMMHQEIEVLDPLNYIFQKPMPTGRLAKWQILLTEFDIVYVTRTAMKSQALEDHLAENPIDDEYQPLRTYFPDEEVNSVEAKSEDTHA
ncbi:uncharacterized protein [Nicotiana sylvestris]|uniref:uncharacterized protein n=1 Tax=Nicotiana sylvestris TaxID=4096 RepID=UPI00388C8802